MMSLLLRNQSVKERPLKFRWFYQPKIQCSKTRRPRWADPQSAPHIRQSLGLCHHADIHSANVWQWRRCAGICANIALPIEALRQISIFHIQTNRYLSVLDLLHCLSQCHLLAQVEATSDECAFSIFVSSYNSNNEDGKADYSSEVATLASAGGDACTQLLVIIDQGGKGIIQNNPDSGAFDRFILSDGMIGQSCS